MASFRRMKLNRVKKWLIGSGIAVSAVGLSLFYYLAQAGFITIASINEDVICASDKCYIDVNFTVGPFDIFLYPDESWLKTNNTDLIIVMKRSWGKSWRTIPMNDTCTGSWCGCYWCTSSNKAKYSYVFRAFTTYSIRYYVYGKKPWESLEFKFFEECPSVKGIGKSEDYFRISKTPEGEVNRYVDLDEAWTEYWDCNPTMNTITAKQKDFGVHFPVGDEYVKSYRREYRVIEERTRIVDNLTRYKWIAEIRNYTDVNSSRFENLSRWEAIYEKVNETYNYTYWIEDVPDTKAGECRLARIYGDLKVVLGERNIEHVPEIYGENFTKYDWWNVSYGYKNVLYAKTTSGSYQGPILANDTCFYAHGGSECQLAWVYADVTTTWTNVTTLYHNDETDYTFSNESAEVCYDVDEGNVTDGCSPWGVNALLVMHNHTADSSSYSQTIDGNSGVTASTGQVGNGYNFTASSSEYINVSDPTLQITTGGAYTLMAWVKPSDLAANYGIMHLGDAGDSRISMMVRTDGTIFSYAQGQTTYCMHTDAVSSGSLTAGQWSHVAIVIDLSGSGYQYINGVQDGSDDCSGCGTFSDTGKVLVGSHTPWGLEMFFNGDMDEARVYNRSLSADEVLFIYNNTKGTHNMSLFAAEKSSATSPTVTLNSPDDNYNSSSTLITFNCSSSGTTTNITLYHNLTAWHTNETNTSGTEGVYVFTKGFGTDGDYVWNCYACNSNGCAFGTNRTFTVDTVAPDINFISPTPDNGTRENDDWIYINVSADELLDGCLLEWNGTNETMTRGGSVSFYVNKTGLSEDVDYTFIAWCNDSALNLNRTQDSRYISMDVYRLYLNGTRGNVYYEIGSTANLTAYGIGETCISINLTGYSLINCSNGYAHYDFNTIARSNNFNGSTSMNLTKDSDVTIGENKSYTNVTFDVFGYYGPTEEMICDGGYLDIKDRAYNNISIGIHWDGTYFWVSYHRANNTYGSDYRNGTIYKYYNNHTLHSSFTGPNCSLTGIASNGTDVFVGCWNLNEIWVYNTTGSFIANYDIGYAPAGMDVNDSELWIMGNSQLRNYYTNNLTWKETNITGFPAYSWGVSITDNNIYTTESYYNTIYKRYPNGTSIDSRTPQGQGCGFDINGFTHNDTYHFAVDGNDGKAYIYTYNVSGYPENITIDWDNDGTYDLWYPGILKANTFYNNETSNGSRNFNMTFSVAGTQTFGIYMPANVSIELANLTIHGHGGTDYYAIKKDFNGYYGDSEIRKYGYRIGVTGWTCADDPDYYTMSEYGNSDYEKIWADDGTTSTVTYDGHSMKCIYQYFRYYIPEQTDEMNNITLVWSGDVDSPHGASESTEILVWDFDDNEWDGVGSGTGQGYQTINGTVTNFTKYISNKWLAYIVRVDGVPGSGIDLAINTDYSNCTLNMNVSYPSNISIDTGFDGDEDYNWSGVFHPDNGTKDISINITELQEHVDAIEGKWGLVDIAALSGATGTLEILEIDIRYNLTDQSNQSEINVTGTEGIVGIDADVWGKVELSSLEANHYGDVDFNITSNGTYHNAFVRWSNYSMVPVNDWAGDGEVVFYFTSNSTSNATPWGQDTDTPYFNITNLVEHNASIGIRLNETMDSCMNMTVSNTTNKSGGFILTTSYQTIYENLTASDDFGVRFWVDTGNCVGGLYNDYVDFDAVCAKCLRWW